MENLIFTVVDPESCGETQIHLDYENIGGHDDIPAEPVKLRIGDESVTIDRQQLTELAALLLALAGTVAVDYSGADSLLEGFGLKGKQAAQNLANALEE